MTATKHRTGWAYGTIDGSDEWLTIWGSYYTRPVLHPTEDDAKAAFDASPFAGDAKNTWVICHVTEVPMWGVSSGYAYQITR
jgi:hypothetical protein